MSDKLFCERNGVTQWFTRKSWDLLGTNKLGWVEVPVEPPTPKEVAQATRVEAIPPVSIPGRLDKEQEKQPKTRKPRKQ